MDYSTDGRLAKLLSQSEDLSRRSQEVGEKCARQSTALREMLARSAEICAASDKLCGRTSWKARGWKGAARPGGRHLF